MTKKTYFTDKESQSIFFTLSKLPSAEVLKDALINYKTQAISNDQIQDILRCWPKESSFEDFATEKLGKDEVWAPAEAYMMKLTKPTSLLDRIKVWSFKEEWHCAKELVF